MSLTVIMYKSNKQIAISTIVIIMLGSPHVVNYYINYVYAHLFDFTVMCKYFCVSFSFVNTKYNHSPTINNTTIIILYINTTSVYSRKESVKTCSNDLCTKYLHFYQ